MTFKTSTRNTFFIILFLGSLKLMICDSSIAQTPPKSFISKQKADINTSNEYSRLPLSVQSEIAKFNFEGNEVWFYKNYDLSGDKKVLKVGQFTLEHLGNDWNDAISSCLIPNHICVQFFVDNHFKGHYLKIIGGSPTHHSMKHITYNFSKIENGTLYNPHNIILSKHTPLDFNDKTSSIIISVAQ